MAHIEYNWYAVYTKSRSEKKTFTLLVQRGIEAYLPLQKKLKQWSDRKKWVEEPLFNSYVFVKISEKEYYEVLQTPGVVKYVTFSKKAAPIREEQIIFLKSILNSDIEIELIDYKFSKGQKVKIIAGPFQGKVGELADVKNTKQFLIRFDEIGQALSLKIPTIYLEPLI